MSKLPGVVRMHGDRNTLSIGNRQLPSFPVQLSEAMQSLAGQLLIASTQLMDPNFVRTVLIMVQHSEDGALGLILNRPTQTSVKEACQQVLGVDCEVPGLLQHGGPCEGPLMVVHRHQTMSDSRIMPEVFFTTDRTKIEWVMKYEPEGSKYFVGYAGWSPGQLEAEMKLGSWLPVAAKPEHIFDADEDLWQKIMTQITMGKW